MLEHPWAFVAVLIVSFAVGVLWPRKRSKDGKIMKARHRENLP